MSFYCVIIAPVSYALVSSATCSIGPRKEEAKSVFNGALVSLEISRRPYWITGGMVTIPRSETQSCMCVCLLGRGVLVSQEVGSASLSVGML